MSRVNIESLLQIQPIQPNVSPVQTQPDYKTSQFSGGQIQLGQAAQQIGPSSDAAMFGALAEIAGGVGKGIDIFGNISSMIEKEKINKAETYFDEISTKEDLTPDQKQEAWDAYLKEVYTPIVGETWKAKLNNQMTKQWTSTEARNQYEAQRYEKAYNAWRRLPANSGRPETNELIQEFNNQYILQYPSASNNDWFTQLTTKVNTSIDLDNAKQAAIDFEDMLIATYRSPSKEELDTYNNSTNMEFNANFEQSYKTYFELQKKLESTRDFKAQYAAVLKHMEENVLNPAKAGMNAVQYKLIAEKIDQIAMVKTKEIVASINAGNITRLQQSSNLNIAANELNYETKKSIPDYLDIWTRNVGLIEPQNRFLQTSQLMATLWSGYESGTSETSIRFRAMPLDQQINFIETQFRSWYANNKKAFQNATGLGDNEIENIIESGKFIIKNDDKRGGRFIGQTFDRLGEDTTRLKVMSGIIPDINKALSEYEKNTATILGISVTSFQKLTVERTQTGVGLTPTKQTYEWFLSLPAEEQKTLSDRGFTAKNFTLLEDYRTKYTDLLQTILGGGQGKSGSGGGGDKLPMKISSFSDGELHGKIIGNAEVRTLASVISQTPPEQLSQSGALAEAARVQSTMQQVDSQFRIFTSTLNESTERMIRQSTETNEPLVENPYPPSFEYFYENGILITEPPSASRFLSGRQTYIDGTNSLTDAGKREYLRLRFTAQQYSSIQGGDSEEKNKFAQDAKSLMTRIGSVGIKRIMDEDPASFYAAAAIFSGLADSGGITEANTFLGEDSELMKAVGALVVNASNTAGGILDLSPVDDPKETDSKKQRARQHVDLFATAMDLFFTPVASKGGGVMNPLIEGKFNQAEPINQIVSNFFTGITSAGPNDLRSEEGTNALLQRLNLRGSTSDPVKTASEFGQALWEITGRKLPKLNNEDDSKYVYVPNPDGGLPITKQWTKMEMWEKINYYLTNLHATNPSNTESLFTGWLRMSQDPKNKDIMTIDVFKNTAGFLLKDVLEAKNLPGLTQPRLSRYQQTNYTTSSLQEYRLGLPLFGRNAGQQVLETELVPDGIKVKRGDLFKEALEASRSIYIVNNQPVEHPWASPGKFEERIIGIPQRDGTVKYKNESVLIGQVEREDHFVIDTYLTQPMLPSIPNQAGSYEYYRKWAEMVDKRPVSQEMFNEYIRKNTKSVGSRPVAYGSAAPGMSKSNIPGVDPETQVYPSLYQVMAALHKVDLTDENRSIRVDSTGNMYFDIGSKSYMVKSARLSPTIELRNNPDETAFNTDRALLEKNRNNLTLIRKQKLFAEKEGTPVVPFILKHNLEGTRFLSDEPDFGIPFKKTGESDTEAFLRLIDKATVYNFQTAQDQQKINVSTAPPFGEFSYPQEEQKPLIFTPEYERELKSQESLNQARYVTESVEENITKAMEFVDRIKSRQNSKATQEMIGANIQHQAETLLDYYITLIETKGQPDREISLQVLSAIIMFEQDIKEEQDRIKRQQTRQQSKATQEMVTANVAQETERAFMDYIKFAQEIQNLIEFKNSFPRKNIEQEQTVSELTVEELRKLKELREAYNKQFGGNQ